MSLQRFGLSSREPPGKKKSGEKRKANTVYEKRRETEYCKIPGSEQPVVKSTCCSSMIRQRMRCSTPRVVTTPQESSINNHNRLTSLEAQPSSLRELRTTNNPLCMNTASKLCTQRRTQARLTEPNL